ncbi:MAG TPA: hypothetical protein VK797_19030 [Tepidisphaeraceae bacterium]|nr:hypothetical protein [Tepidisphaeraceae bacterium]
MLSFVFGVFSSITAALIGWFAVRRVWPFIQDRMLYNGIRIDGIWDICSLKDGKEEVVGKLELFQQGSRITGTGHRTQTRQGAPSDRRFKYSGRIVGDQVTLLFQDVRGKDFDSGSYIFCVHNDYVVMDGMATFHGKPENRIVSERRVLKKTATPLPVLVSA